MGKKQTSMLERLIAAIDSILDDKNTRITSDNDGMAQIGLNSKDRSKQELLKFFRETYERSDARQKIYPGMFTSEVSEDALKSHIGLFNELFADHVDQNTELMHVSSIIQGEQGFSFEISPVDFIKDYAVHAAVLLGTRKVAKLLIEWINCNKIEFTKKFHLQGIEVASPLTLDYESNSGIMVNPPNQEHFDILLNKKVEIGLVLGEGAIVTIRRTEPVFFKPEQSSDSEDANDSNIESDTDFIDKICSCLSLVLNSIVSLNCWWVHDWNILPFQINANIERTSGRKSEHAPSVLIQEDLNRALKILPNFKKLSANKRFRISVRRGLKSMHTLTEYEDKIINMRIAMESLLLKGNESGIKEKLAIISAKFLKAKLPGRRKVRNTMENFYKDSSSIVHGNKNAEDVKIDIKAIQNLWNELILKILEEGKIPNWDDIVLE